MRAPGKIKPVTTKNKIDKPSTPKRTLAPLTNEKSNNDKHHSNWKFVQSGLKKIKNNNVWLNNITAEAVATNRKIGLARSFKQHTTSIMYKYSKKTNLSIYLL